MRTLIRLYAACTLAVLLAACQHKVPTTYTNGSTQPHIHPDYIGVTIPPNIAPLHFYIEDEADEYITRITAGGQQWVGCGRKVCTPTGRWRDLLAAASELQVEVYTCHDGQWTRQLPFSIQVAKEPVDPYLSYRLISPSYVTYKDLTLNQRDLTTYQERIIYGNLMNMTEENGQCINCHHYQWYNPNRMQFHVRQYQGGTVICCDGRLSKVNLKTDSVISAGVYPAWHPTDNVIAYSVNNTGQTFHTRDIQKVEVQDMASDLILYDVERNEVYPIAGAPDELEVFPAWSPDGKWLYYASAHFASNDTTDMTTQTIRRYQDIKYDLYRRPYDSRTRTLGAPDTVFMASRLGKSATLPRVSPCGHYLMFTMASFGVFHIWHKDADLYLLDLRTHSLLRMDELNSPDVESYHSWSSNGRWVVFSSRRNDGNFTRPFLAYVDARGQGRKPFELPQDDPLMHRQFTRSYNIPEFMNGPVTVSPQELGTFISQNEARPAKQVIR